MKETLLSRWKEAALGLLGISISAYVGMAQSSLNQRIDDKEQSIMTYINAKDDASKEQNKLMLKYLDRIDKRVDEIYKEIK